jgi:hypothetical protein
MPKAFHQEWNRNAQTKLILSETLSTSKKRALEPGRDYKFWFHFTNCFGHHSV